MIEPVIDEVIAEVESEVIEGDGESIAPPEKTFIGGFTTDFV